MGSVCHGYICFLLYMKPYAVCSHVVHRSMVDLGGWGHCLPWVYVHSSIGETYLV